MNRDTIWHPVRSRLSATGGSDRAQAQEWEPKSRRLLPVLAGGYALGNDVLMTLIDFAVVAVVGYLAVTGLNFLLRPGSVSLYSLSPNGATGRTEVRCYYGALALGLAGFIAYLGLTGLGHQAITGMLFIAGAIFVARLFGTMIDGGWTSSYTRLAIPVEAGFVIALGVVLLTH